MTGWLWALLIYPFLFPGASGDLKDDRTASPLLGSLLGPQPGLASFLRDFWQQKPAVIRRNNSDFFSNLLSKDDVDQILRFGVSLQNHSHEGMERGKDYKLVRRIRAKDGEWWSAAPAHDLSQHLSDEALARLAFQRGFSLVIDNMEERWDAVRLLAKSIEDELHYRVGVNLYLSPPESQGFEAHFDWMDAIVLQIEGEKSWKLYDAQIDCPRPDMKTRVSTRELEDPFVEFKLRAGDVLYLPAGVIHEANTRGLRTPSLHLTVGVESSVIGSYESLLLHAALGATDSTDGYYSKAPKDGSAPSNLSSLVSPSACSGPEGGLRLGDLLLAVIVETASRDPLLRRAVPLSKLAKKYLGPPERGLNRSAQSLLQHADVSKALERLLVANGTLPRIMVGTRGAAAFQHLQDCLRQKSCQAALQVALEDNTLHSDITEALRHLGSLLRTPKSQRTILKSFEKLVSADRDSRRSQRMYNLQRCQERSDAELSVHMIPNAVKAGENAYIMK